MKLKIGKISNISRALGSGIMHHGRHVLCGEALVVEVGGEMGPLSFHTTQNVFCTRPT